MTGGGKNSGREADDRIRGQDLGQIQAVYRTLSK